MQQFTNLYKKNAYFSDQPKEVKQIEKGILQSKKDMLLEEFENLEKDSMANNEFPKHLELKV